MSPVYDRLRDGESETQSLNDGAEKHGHLLQINNPRRSTLRQAREILFAVTGLLCLWIALVAAWRTTLHPTPRALQYKKRAFSCGNTTEAAEANGCVFDLLSHNWLPAACMDYEITAEFREWVLRSERDLGSWPYFLDDQAKERVKDEATLAYLPHTLVMSSQEEHLAHCDFLIRRIHRAAAGFANIDEKVSRMSHTQHCLRELRSPTPTTPDRLTVGFWVGFSNCTLDIPV